MENEYLTDVGFGEFSFEPLIFEMDIIQPDERGDYVFDKHDEHYFRVNKIEDDQIIPQYIFKNIKREFSEFSEMCEFHQTSSKSHFTQNKLVSLPNENGRITLTGDKLKITENEITSEAPFLNENEFAEKLKFYFNLDFIKVK